MKPRCRAVWGSAYRAETDDLNQLLKTVVAADLSSPTYGGRPSKSP
jgi:hypothetical protein